MLQKVTGKPVETDDGDPDGDSMTVHETFFICQLTYKNETTTTTLHEVSHAQVLHGLKLYKAAKTAPEEICR